MKNIIYAIMGGIVFLGGLILTAFTFLMTIAGLEFGILGFLLFLILDGHFVLFAFSVMMTVFGFVMIRANLRARD